MNNIDYANKELLFKYLGGSHLYGLANENSDIDWRGIFINTDPEKILRFTKDDTISTTGREGEDDVVYYSLWRFFDLLRSTNTQAVESLYVDKNDCEFLDRRLEEVLDDPTDFMDTNKLVNSIKGYSYGEYRLAMGERTGKLGSKRYEQLQTYGFSPKNVTQMIRLSRGLTYFQDTGVYPLKMKDHMLEVWELAYEIKNQPENFTKEQIKIICEECLSDVNKVEDKLGYNFNNKRAVSIMTNIYKPYL